MAVTIMFDISNLTTFSPGQAPATELFAVYLELSLQEDHFRELQLQNYFGKWRKKIVLILLTKGSYCPVIQTDYFRSKSGL
jgi:hypothetical protein